MTTERSNAFVERMRQCTMLTEAELQVLRDLPVNIQNYEAHRDIVTEGDRPKQCFTVLDGVASSYKLTGDGARQITAFHIAGDMPDLHSLQLHTIDTSICTITPCNIGFVEHHVLHAVCAESYSIAAALWRITLIDGAIFREWETNLGRREAERAMAHLICEQYARLEAVGRTEGTSFAFPVTQQELGDALGLSTVHVNRTLQRLRMKAGLRFEGGKVDLFDWPTFAAEGDFDPAYLHLKAKH